MKKLSVLIVTLLFGIAALQAQPVASFTGPTETCGNQPTNYVSTSTGDITSYNWQVNGFFASGGPTQSSPDITFESYDLSQNQVHNLCLIVTDDQGLQDTYCEDITVYPFVAITVINPTLCEEESITEGGNVYDINNPYGEENYVSVNGCDSVVIILLNFESGFQIANLEIEEVPYQQSSGGSISFDLICGEGPYTYEWATLPAGTENLATGLFPGFYFVTVTDVDNNTTTNSFLVPEGEVMTFDVELTGLVQCEEISLGGNPGSVLISWSGGTPPYRIRRNGSQIFYIEEGEGFSRDNSIWWVDDYEFSIEDDNGNIVVFPELITVDFIHASFDVYASPGDTMVCLGQDVELEAVTISDAISFQWGGDDVVCNTCPITEPTDLGLFGNFYTLAVEDEHGCFSADTVYITGMDCDPVWPGDTDTNTVVNNFDLLNIGLAFDATGENRNNATLDWIAQPALDWADNNPNGSNYKHSDTDGNGLVNSDDTLAITLNWGEEHNFSGGTPSNLMPIYPPAPSSGITMPFYVQPDTFIEGETLSLPVILGEMGAEAENVYGIAFTLEFDPAIIVSGSAYLTFDNSWIGTINNDMIDVQKAFHSDGKIDVCLTRTDHTSVTGFGQMADLFITIEDDILFQSGGSNNLVTTADGEAVFNITNVLILNSEGEQLEVLPTETTSVILDTSTATKNINDTKLVQLYPNPANDNLRITTQSLMIKNVQLFALDGQLLESISPNTERYQLSTAAIHDGIYIIRIQTSEGVVNKRVTILH